MMVNYRKLVESVIGRKLLPTEIVHHIDGNHRYNNIDNFYVYDNQKRHVVHHIKMGTIAMGLLNCRTDEQIVRYVKRRILPMIKKSNIYYLMNEDKEGDGK